MGANSIPTDATIDLDEQIGQLMQCKPLSEQQVPPFVYPRLNWNRIGSYRWLNLRFLFLNEKRCSLFLMWVCKLSDLMSDLWTYVYTLIHLRLMGLQRKYLFVLFHDSIYWREREISGILQLIRGINWSVSVKIRSFYLLLLSKWSLCFDISLLCFLLRIKGGERWTYHHLPCWFVLNRLEHYARKPRRSWWMKATFRLVRDLASLWCWS